MARSRWLSIPLLFILAGGCAPPEPVDLSGAPAGPDELVGVPIGDPPGIVPGEILLKLDAGTSLTSAPTLHRIFRNLGAISAQVPWRAPPAGAPDARRWFRVRPSPHADPLGAVRRAQDLVDVEVAQLEYVYAFDRMPDDPEYPDQWAHRAIGSEAAWDLSVGSRDVVVAVIGNGVQVDHPDLAANVWVNPGEIAGTGRDDAGNGYVDDVHGYDFHLGRADITPSGSHETQVAGLIGAVGDNGVGIAGVAWAVSIMALRVEPTSSQVAEAIYYAVHNGAHVINMSFSSYDPGVYGPDALVSEALEAAEAADVVVVASAGNDGRATPKYPAALPTVLGVASTTPEEGRAEFSNFGEWVSVSAPGVGLVTTDLGGGYYTVHGTSYSAPLVAGVAVLMRARDPGLSAATIRRIIAGTGTPLGNPEPIGRRLDAHAAVQLPTELPPPPRFAASFWNPRGNDWWVEVEVSANHALAGVDARLEDGDWVALSFTDWWVWGESFFVPDDAWVRFRARSAEAEASVESGWYRWPEGTLIPGTTPEPEPAVDPDPATEPAPADDPGPAPEPDPGDDPDPEPAAPDGRADREPAPTGCVVSDPGRPGAALLLLAGGLLLWRLRAAPSSTGTRCSDDRGIGRRRRSPSWCCNRRIDDPGRCPTRCSPSWCCSRRIGDPGTGRNRNRSWCCSRRIAGPGTGCGDNRSWCCNAPG